MVEPVAGNMGCIPPADGFLSGLRDACTQHGALLIFDEVMTGFRVAPGGAQQRYGVMPDLTTLGKIGPVYQAGTLSGNPLATAAGTAMLSYLHDHPEVYQQLEERGRQLDDGWATLIQTRGYPLTWNRVGSMGSLFFSTDPVTSWESAARSDRDAFTRYFSEMLDLGIYLAPSPFEAAFLSAAHTASDIKRTLEAANFVLERMYRK
jgi:glutamate-1-semialdehyde 2,1-aminomutase